MTYLFPPTDTTLPRPGEIIVDSFAGGGGASTGIFLALARHPDVAVNHDPEAVAMHTANHPTTEHFCQNVWQVNPGDVASRGPIGLAWFSPDCKHFSKAKGGKPVEKGIRDLAWVVVSYAKLPRHQRPRVIILENVVLIEPIVRNLTMNLLTIGEPPEIDGWVADGVQELTTMLDAVNEHSGITSDEWPRHTMVEVTRAHLECWGCGCTYGKAHVEGCEYDNDDGEGWVWIFGTGGDVTILMRDGRSVFDHFPQHRREAAQ